MLIFQLQHLFQLCTARVQEYDKYYFAFREPIQLVTPA
jgi:hypothetical protein